MTIGPIQIKINILINNQLIAMRWRVVRGKRGLAGEAAGPSCHQAIVGECNSTT